MTCRRTIFFIVTMVLLLNQHAHFAVAENCVNPPVERRVAISKAVFTGEVASIEDLGDVGSSERFVVTLNLIRSFKGPRSSQLKLYNLSNSQASRVHLYRVGQKYLVFATERDFKNTFPNAHRPALTAYSQCLMPLLLDEAENELDFLGEGFPPQ